MKKEKEIFKEADARAQLEQARIIFKEPIYIESDFINFEMRPITCRNSAKIGSYAVRQVDVGEVTEPNLIAASRVNLKLQCKAASIALLSDSRLWGLVGRFKLWFFPIHWRILFGRLDNSDLNELFMAMVKKQGNMFFFQSTALVMELNSLKKKKTTQEVKSIQAEQKSD